MGSGRARMSTGSSDSECRTHVISPKTLAHQAVMHWVYAQLVLVLSGPIFVGKKKKSSFCCGMYDDY